MKICVSFVTYNIYNDYEWTKLCVNSFKNIFQNSVDLFVVDHNNNKEELNFLKKNKIEIIENKSSYKLHGDGLDLAADYLGKQGYDAVVFVEPDCVFTSRVWYDGLVQSLENGKSMAGCYQLCDKSLHPCGSAWKIKDIPGSFNSCFKTKEDLFDESYGKIIDLKSYFKGKDEKDLFFFMYFWDAGIRNWFLLAKQNKTELVNSDGFQHFWFSHQLSLKNLIKNKYFIKKLNLKNCFKEFI